MRLSELILSAVAFVALVGWLNTRGQLREARQKVADLLRRIGDIAAGSEDKSEFLRKKDVAQACVLRWLGQDIEQEKLEVTHVDTVWSEIPGTRSRYNLVGDVQGQTVVVTAYYVAGLRQPCEIKASYGNDTVDWKAAPGKVLDGIEAATLVSLARFAQNRGFGGLPFETRVPGPS